METLKRQLDQLPQLQQIKRLKQYEYNQLILSETLELDHKKIQVCT